MKSERESISDDALRYGVAAAVRLRLYADHRDEFALEFVVWVLEPVRYAQFLQSGRSLLLLTYWANNLAMVYRRKLISENVRVRLVDDVYSLEELAAMSPLSSS